VALEEGLAEASRMSEVGESAEALDLLLELEPEHSEDAALMCMIGALAEELGADGMAVDFFKRCLDLEPTDPELLVVAGSGLARSGDGAAEAALRLAALTSPDLAAARFQYGAYLIRSGIFDLGVEELTAARNLDPDDPDIRLDLGIGYLLAGRQGDAIAELESAREASPDDPLPRLILGLTLLQFDDLSRAAEELHPAAEQLAADPEAQLLLALVFAAEGWEEEAWLALARAEDAPERVDTQAIQEVEDAIEEGPEAARALLVDEVAASALRDRIFKG
jgi:Flp pilus assembly protein TadD